MLLGIYLALIIHNLATLRMFFFSNMSVNIIGS